MPVAVGMVVPAVDIALGRLLSAPTANGNGPAYASFLFQVQDDGGTIGGGQDLDPTPNTMTFNVVSVNDAPIGMDNTRALSPCSPFAYTFSPADFLFADPNDNPSNGREA